MLVVSMLIIIWNQTNRRNQDRLFLTVIYFIKRKRFLKALELITKDLKIA
ncbi:hypothetical protein [Oenococcus oeni]|nr:hypothetical protein [Oenococcus oeni]KZD13123.1 hypothetical protein AC229_0046 [Oenococcus oeni]